MKAPVTRDHCWRRRVGPKLEEAGLGWVNFQVMRRTHSSLMNDLKVDPKIVADQLGHTLERKDSRRQEQPGTAIQIWLDHQKATFKARKSTMTPADRNSGV